MAKGLAAPKAVIDATAKYLEAEDAINTWIDECCERDRNAFTASSLLFASWTAWATRSGEKVGSQKTMVENLSNRGFEQVRQRLGDRDSNPTRGFARLRIAS